MISLKLQRVPMQNPVRTRVRAMSHSSGADGICLTSALLALPQNLKLVFANV